MSNPTTEKNPTTEAEQIELETVEAQYWHDHKEALDRLRRNPDFQLVIEEGYFKDRAVEGVSLLASDYIRQSGRRPELMEVLVAISNLKQHFLMIDNLGTIPEDEELEEFDEIQED